MRDKITISIPQHKDKIDKFRYYYYPGIWEPGTTFLLHVNQKAWEALTPEYKKILEASCAQVYAEILSDYQYKNSIAIRKLENHKNIKLCKFDPDLLSKLEKRTTEFLEDRYEDNENKSHEDNGNKSCRYSIFLQAKFTHYQPSF